jgi:hypothetical protein
VGRIASLIVLMLLAGWSEHASAQECDEDVCIELLGLKPNARGMSIPPRELTFDVRLPSEAPDDVTVWVLVLRENSVGGWDRVHYYGETLKKAKSAKHCRWAAESSDQRTGSFVPKNGRFKIAVALQPDADRWSHATRPIHINWETR